MAIIGSSLRKHRWYEELRRRELELLDPETRSDSKRLGDLLHDDFVEFGSSGSVYEKQMLIEMMVDERPAPVMVRDFAVRQLGTDTALVTYRTVGQAGQEARRSSVWIRDASGWRLVFHQGTRIPNAWGSIG
ncbi:MAG TPA: DUF4440 domain-containing protein [Acidimicrobiia bacterium]|jgi:hypothetical protein|nr:DUF4440 domain-containing protein [Acidimicrobiia bacterium]